MGDRCVFYIGQNPNLYCKLFELTRFPATVQICTAPAMVTFLGGGSLSLGPNPILVIDAVSRVFYFTYEEILELIAKARAKKVKVWVVVSDELQEVYEPNLKVTARRIMFNPRALLA